MSLEIEDSIHIDSDISLRHWIYLNDQGYSFNQVKIIQCETNNLIKKKMRGIFEDDHLSIHKLGDLVCLP